MRADLLAAAKAGLPGAAIVDQMQPGEGAPQGWADVAVASLRELARLESGSADMKDATLVVSGVAADAATAEAIRATLRAAVPATIKLTDQIQVKEPPPPRRRPRAAAPTGPPEARAPARPKATRRPPRQSDRRRCARNAAKAEAKPARPTRGAPTQPCAASGASRPAEPSPLAPNRGATPAEPGRDRPSAGKACEEQAGKLAQAGTILFRLASAELESASFPDARQARRGRQVLPGHAHRGRRPRQLRRQRRDQSAALAQARAIRGSVSGEGGRGCEAAGAGRAMARRGRSRPTTPARTWPRTGASNSPSGRSSARPARDRVRQGHMDYLVVQARCGGCWSHSRSAW